MKSAGDCFHRDFMYRYCWSKGPEIYLCSETRGGGSSPPSPRPHLWYLFDGGPEPL